MDIVPVSSDGDIKFRFTFDDEDDMEFWRNSWNRCVCQSICPVSSRHIIDIFYELESRACDVCNKSNCDLSIMLSLDEFVDYSLYVTYFSTLFERAAMRVSIAAHEHVKDNDTDGLMELGEYLGRKEDKSRDLILEQLEERVRMKHKSDFCNRLFAILGLVMGAVSIVCGITKFITAWWLCLAGVVFSFFVIKFCKYRIMKDAKSDAQYIEDALKTMRWFENLPPNFTF